MQNVILSDDVRWESDVRDFKRLDGEFLNYRDSLPDEYDLIVSANNFSDFLDRVALLRSGFLVLHILSPTGETARIVQTLSSVNLTLTTIERKETSAPRRPIGFDIEGTSLDLQSAP